MALKKPSDTLTFNIRLWDHSWIASQNSLDELTKKKSRITHRLIVGFNVSVTTRGEYFRILRHLNHVSLELNIYLRGVLKMNPPTKKFESSSVFISQITRMPELTVTLVWRGLRHEKRTVKKYHLFNVNACVWKLFLSQ